MKSPEEVYDAMSKLDDINHPAYRFKNLITIGLVNNEKIKLLTQWRDEIAREEAIAFQLWRSEALVTSYKYAKKHSKQYQKDYKSLWKYEESEYNKFIDERRKEEQ